MIEIKSCDLYKLQNGPKITVKKRFVTRPLEYDQSSALTEVSCQNVFSLAEITILFFC